MREIKFRAWDKLEKQMVDVQQIEFYDDGTLYGAEVWYHDGSDIYGVEFEHEEAVLLQYTGLKDKKGVEIYDGDIVATPSGNKFVKWLDDESRFAVCSDGKCIKSFNSLGNYCDDAKNLTCSRLEVIGNIYEHPHLLESR